MRDILDKLYLRVSLIDTIYLRKALRYIIRCTSLYYWRLVCLFPITIKNKSDDIIVSMTSFPDRIDNIYLVCNSLLRQTLSPSVLYLWLSKKQFNNFRLPKRLLKLQKYGLSIQYIEDDYKSHKKYYYTLLNHPDKPIILTDDDIIYNSKLIETLVNEAKMNPNCIIAQYGRIIRYSNNKVCSYHTWEKTYKSGIYKDLFFGSGGGTYIPPGSMYKDILNSDLFLNLTPTADDIWLNAMARLQNTKIYKSSLNSALITVPSETNITLSSINNSNSSGSINNDYQINNINSYYKKLIF